MPKHGCVPTGSRVLQLSPPRSQCTHAVLGFTRPQPHPHFALLALLVPQDLVQLPPHSLAPMGSFGGFAPSGPPTAAVPPAASGPLCGADAVEVIAHNAMRAAAAGGSSGASGGEAGGAAPQEWSPPLDCAVPAAEPLGPFEAFCPAAVRSHDGRSPGLPNGAGLVMW